MDHLHHQNHGLHTNGGSGVGSTDEYGRIRLKCIVLGAAAAGKTSVLRRYFHGTFEYGAKSTIGADFYSRKVKNPVHVRAEDEIDVGAEDEVNNNGGTEARGGGRPYLAECVGESSNRSLRSSARNSSRDTLTLYGSPSSRSLLSEPRAGGSSRNLNSGGNTSSPPWSSRKRGRKTKATEWVPSITRETHVNLQMWDTAGKERMGGSSSDKNDKFLSSYLGNSFFRHADAAMLVYDATSSRSFTQLIRWYSELTERIDRVAARERGGEDLRDNDVTSGGSGARSLGEKIPIVVVANKVDRLRKTGRSLAATRGSVRPRVVPQRDVMGLGGQFKGKDHRYEYSVSGSPSSSDLATAEKKYRKRNSRPPPRRRHDRLSYALTDTTWTTEKDYLTSVIRSEDVSFPDRDMVVLWCRRNGLCHVEVSAVDGTGLEAAMDAVVVLGLESLNKRRRRQRMLAASAVSKEEENDAWKRRGTVMTTARAGRLRGGESLDLHKRYAPRERTDCCWRLLPWLK